MVAVGHTQHNILTLVPYYLGCMGIKSQQIQFRQVYMVQWRSILTYTWRNAPVRWASGTLPAVVLAPFPCDSLCSVSFRVLASSYDWMSHFCMTTSKRKRRENGSESSPRKTNDWPGTLPNQRPLIGNLIGPQWVVCPFLNQPLARRKPRFPVVQLGLSKVLVVELAHPGTHGGRRGRGQIEVLFGRRNRE